MGPTPRRAFLKGIAGTGAWLALSVSPVTRLSAAGPVRGRVVETRGRSGLAGVAVSNGRDVVRTGADGSFALPDVTPEYPFVFVNVPRGYRPRTAFFARLGTAGRTAGPSDPLFLELIPDRSRESSRLRIAHVSDTHIGVASAPHFVSPDDLAADLDTVVTRSSPDLIIVTGDLTDLGRREDLVAYRDVVGRAARPVVSLYAGHDGTVESLAEPKGTTVAANRAFVEVVGPDQWSFDWGPYHFVLFPEVWGDTEGREERTRAWFADDLAQQPRDARIIVVTHDPPRRHPQGQPGRCGPSISDMTRHPGVFLALHGQYHCARIVESEGIAIVGATSLSMGSIDGTPRGYVTIDLDAGRVKSMEVVSMPARPASPRRPATRVMAAPLPPLALTARGPARHDVSWHRADPAISSAGLFVMPAGDSGPVTSRGLYGLDGATGERVWFLPTDSTIKNGVVLGRLGETEVAFGCSVAGRVHALRTHDGTLHWSADLPDYPDRWCYSRPVLADSRVLIATRTRVTCLHQEDGRLLWERARGGLEDNASSATYHEPIAVGDSLVYLQARAPVALTALRVGDGDVLWKRPLDEDMSQYFHVDRYEGFFQIQFGSPVTAGDWIVSSAIADRLAVVHARTGDLLWNKPVLYAEGPEGAATSGRHLMPAEYGTGLAVDGTRIVVSSANGYVVCVDLLSGRRLWQFAAARPPLLDVVPYHRGRANALTRPVRAHGYWWTAGADGHVYGLDPDTGRLAVDHDLGVAVTVAPVATDSGLVLFATNGAVHWLDRR